MNNYYYGSTLHYKNCLTDPMVPSCFFGGLFAGIDAFQHGTPFRLRAAGSYMAGLYTYNIMQCPMEGIHGRPSLWHNVISGGILGYVGVSSGNMGVPLVDSGTIYRLYSKFGLRPEMVAFGVYGGMAGAFAAFGGKRM